MVELKDDSAVGAVPRSSDGAARGAMDTAVGARAERTIGIGVVAARATFLLQLILSVNDGYSRSPSPAVFTLVAGAMVVESIVFGVVVWRQNSLSPRTAAVDVGLVAVLVALEPLYSSPADRVGTWAAWGFAAAIIVALTAGAGLRRGPSVAVAALVLSGVYVAVSLPAAWGRGMTSTALVNSVAMLGFAAAAWVFARFIRELARLADEARAEAAAVARNAELERQRMLLHDQATVLSWLSHTGLDPAMELALRDQAGRASQQIRAFLAAEPAAPQLATDIGEPLLRDVVSTVAGEFHDLPLTLNVDLVQDQQLEAHVGRGTAHPAAQRPSPRAGDQRRHPRRPARRRPVGAHRHRRRGGLRPCGVDARVRVAGPGRGGVTCRRPRGVYRLRHR